MMPMETAVAKAITCMETAAVEITTTSFTDLDDRRVVSGRMKSNRCSNGAYRRKSDRECSDATQNATITQHFNSP